MGKLPPVAALLDTAKGKTRIRLNKGVYKASPGLQIIGGNAFAALRVTGKYGCPQTESRVVGRLNGFCLIIGLLKQEYRIGPIDFFLKIAYGYRIWRYIKLN